MYRSIVKPTGGELVLLELDEKDNPCIRITIIHPENLEQVEKRIALSITVKRGDLKKILRELNL